MPHTIDRSRLMRRAWHLFRSQFGGVGCIYRRLPRHAMRLAMLEAWREEKAIAAAAALPPAALIARIATIRAAHHNRVHYGSSPRHDREAAELAAELRTLEAAAGMAA